MMRKGDKMYNVPVSIFSYDENLYIKKTSKRKDKSNEVGKAPCGYAIQRILYKYGYANLEMITKALALKEIYRVDVKKSLEIMQMLETVEKFTIYNSEKTRADIDVYTLSEAVWEEMGEKRKEKALYKRNFGDIPYLMECLAATQWHISILYNRKKNKKECTELMFNHPQITSEGIVQIPSLIRIKYTKKKGIFICGIPINRNYNLLSLKKFIVRVAKIDRYFIENADKYYSYAIVIICESLSQIEEVSKLFEVMEETKFLQLFYTIDMITSNTNPLSHVYEVKRHSGKASITLVEF